MRTCLDGNRLEGVEQLRLPSARTLKSLS